jgi:hypothetical protein
VPNEARAEERAHCERRECDTCAQDQSPSPCPAPKPTKTTLPVMIELNTLPRYSDALRATGVLYVVPA